MKLIVARVGLFRGWILVVGLGLMVTAVALVGGSKGLAKTGPALGLAPAVAQQSSASQIDANPLMKRIQSIAQAPRLRVIKERLAPLAPALAPSAAALMPFAPVTITLDASPISGSAVAQGQVIAYAIQATNAASSDTTTGAGGGFVRIVDTAPAGTLFTNATIQQQPQFGSAWSCAILGGGTSIECHAGDGAGAGVDTFTTQEFVKIRAEVTVQAATANGATLTNTATYEFDRDGGGLEGTATSNSVFHVVNPTADLGIIKIASNVTPTAGGAAFSYTVTVTNNGPNAARDVIVSDPLPPGIIFQNVSVVMNPVSPAMTCTGPPVGTNGTIICNSANFPNGQSAVITIFGQVVPNVASVARTNTATVTSGTPEPVPNVFSNTASVTQNIVVNAPLSITKAGPASVCAGDTLTYHVTVLNGGSSTALNATISDPLPANTTFLSLSGTGGFTTGCSFNGGAPGSVTCAAVDIPSGLSTLDITVKLAPSAPSGSLGNTAQITSAGTGTIAAGTSTTTATVNHCSDLEITKDDSPDAVAPGQDINYTIKVRNVGPSNIASGEFVVNDLTFPPTGTTLKTGTTINAPGFDCNGGVTFPCAATSTLAAGATAVINYSVTVNPDFNGGQPGGFVVNTATVSIIAGSNATDSISTNNSSTTNTPVNPSADLSITSTAETLAGGIFGASVTAGGTIAGTLPSPVTGTGEILYTLTYRNNGLGDATNVHVRDDIPAGTLLDPTFLPIGVVVTPAAGPGLTCQILPTLNTYQLDCTPNTASGVLPAAANGTIQFRVRVPENISDGTVIKNQATINSEGAGAAPGTPDPIGGNNTSNITQNIVRTSADLAIAKTGPAGVIAGNNITYTLTVTNNGPSDAQNVVVKDTLPPNVSFVSTSSTDNQFICTPDNGNAGVVNCVSTTLVAPAVNAPPIIPPRSGSNTATITIVGRVNAGLATGTILSNSATVSATTNDTLTTNNAVGPVDTTVTNDASLSITAAGPATVCAGDTLTYHVTVLNGGSSTALGATISDPLPANTTFLNLSGTGGFATGCSLDGGTPGTVTCAAVNIPTGLSTLDITVKLSPTAPSGSLANTATITTAGTGTIAVGTSTTTATVSDCAASDMGITKAADNATPTAGGAAFIYTLTVNNSGPGAGKDVVVTDALPVGVLFQSLSVAGAGTGLSCAGPGVGSNGPVICNSANFPVGSVATVTINGTIAANAAAGVRTNTATVTSGSAETVPNVNPNTASVQQTVQVNAPLSITETGPATVCQGGVLNYQITVNNSGVSTAQGVTISDPLPANTTFMSASGTKAFANSCSQSGGAPGTVTCAGVDVPNGLSTLTVTVQLAADAPTGNLSNTASITNPGTGTVGVGTATSTAAVNACAASDMGITKIVDNANPTAGGAAFIYTLTVNNSGPGAGKDVVVTDALPAGVLFQGLSVAGGGSGLSCAGPGIGSNGPVICNSANFPVGSVATVTINAQMAANAAAGVRTNTATVTSGTAETVPNVNPNAASVQQTVQVTAPLSITETGPATVCQGGVLNYQITVNNSGASTAQGVTISDPLPANTTFMSASGTKAFANSCSQDGGLPGTVTCAGVDVPSGLSTLTVTVQLAADAPTGNLSNTASITNPGTGTVGVGTATSTAVVNACAASDMGITKIVDNANPTAGGAAFIYTLTVNNSGPGAGKDVVVTDPLPAGVLFQSLSVAGAGTGLSCAGPGIGSNGPVICNSANFPVGSVATVTINAQMAANAAAGVRTNTATVTSGTAETVPNVNPNTASVQQTVQVTAPLSITETGPATVCQGGVLNYQITVNNSGVSTAQGVTISDPLPANTTFMSVSGTKAFANTCSPSGGAPGTVTCAGVDVPSGVSTLAVTVQLAADAPTGNLSNTASITNPGTGTVGVGTATSTAVVNACSASDMGINKATDNATPTAGGAAFTYTLTVNNSGPGAGKDVVVTDPLPAGVLFQSLSVAGGGTGLSCAGPGVGSNGPVICNSANFPVGSVATVTINAQMAANAAAGVRTNTATVTSGTAETVPNVNPNTASVQQTVQVNAPLSITETGPGTACPGDTFTYHLTVNNGGSSKAQGVTISDPLPPNTTFLSVSGTGGLANACSHNGSSPGTVTCFGDLRSGQSTADIRVALAAGAPIGVLANTATITNAGTGTIAVGTTTANTTVGCSTVLSISPTTVTEGTGGTTSATFTVTLAAASTQTVTVDYVTLDGTASTPSDYTAQAGTLTFAPGVTTRNILVPIMTDSVPEPTETFLVTLFNPGNATIGTAQGTGTINDDDASGAFQFSAATANVNENAVPGSINLTINRTGDTTGVASVNFETNDITALQKTDYTFNSGNVLFGPGVTSKTVNVLIVNDALVEGPETFRVSLFNASGNFVVNGSTSIAVTINDDDVVPGANPIDSAGSFVRQQYLDFLGREPDPSGLAFWTNQITLCGADPACILERRVNVSGAFFLSIEFQETSGNVIRAQRVAFGRQSEDPATRISYLQFMRDTRQVGAGVIVGQAGYEAVLEANKQAYAQQVVSSPAFNARFPFSPAATYVDALYASAGVTPTAAERTAAINAFGAGAAPGRIAAFRSVADSATLRTAEFTTSFVLAEYFGYLRRNPTDAPDFNDAGYQFWLIKLNLFNGDFQKAEMVKAFITSLEDRGRFGTP